MEKAFWNVKERLNLRRMLASSEIALEGKLFVEFISLIFLSYIQKKMEDKGLFGKYTLHELLDELDVIECFMNPGNALIQGEVLKKQEDLYTALEVKPLLTSAKTSEAYCGVRESRFEINPSYEMIRTLLHETLVTKDVLITETNRITEKLVNAAQRYIALYREYTNGVLSECELFDVVDPINYKISRLYFLQSNLPYPPKELHDWADAHTQLAATIQDFSLLYNKNNLGTWTTENRKFLMSSAIERYESELVALSAAEKTI